MTEHTWSVYNAPPAAGSMIESLRGLGYSPSTALADLTDNSITAGASQVDLSLVWNDAHPYISLLDNGHGMTKKELFDAMRLGYLNPLCTRSGNDLGRFGLGLKTASLSQCRSLTVLSRKKGYEVSSLRWDLDYLAAEGNNDWTLLEEPGNEAALLLPLLEKYDQGTLVVWEKLDRIITPGFTVQHFLDLTDTVERHLALTFHRFLQTSNPALVLTIIGRRIKPADPFMQGHPATLSSPEDHMMTSGGRISMQGYVLPHKDRLSPQDIAEMGDPSGWTEHQGFYVYRNNRLIVSGSWLGLGHGRSWSKEEAYRLARIRLDIPNTADTDWKLDIRKSIASPPAAVKKRLLQLATSIRNRARQVFVYRGGYKRPRHKAEQIEPLWEISRKDTEVQYHISRHHPAVTSLMAESSETRNAVESLLTLIENTIPVQRIWLDAAEGRDAPGRMSETAPSEVMQEILLTVYRNMLRRNGLLPEEIRQQLKRTEPFCEFPDLIENLPDEI